MKNLIIFLLFIFLFSSSANAQTSSDWHMVGANPQRTSWVSEEVRDHRMDWFRPIEAYISQDTQIITANNHLYVATARGLYVLQADNGQMAWRFDTELPLGNSPTVIGNMVYFGSFDRKLYALADNGTNFTKKWEFAGAEAGYSTNPLVVNGVVYIGNRDGNFYALDSTDGNLKWKFKTGGPIMVSAAYKNGVVFFAANDNYAYAVNANTGAQIWKSAKLPGDGFQATWPVIWEDKVVFSAAISYRYRINPGAYSLGTDVNRIYDADQKEIYGDAPLNTAFGPIIQINEPWAEDKTVMDASRIVEYLETKPWRRTVIILNMSNGEEYTFDSDHDGLPEYAPFTMVGTQAGNRYPPVVGSDGILYQTNTYVQHYIPEARVFGWRIGTPYLILQNAQSAVDQPKALSLGGNTLYRTNSTDSRGSWFDLNNTNSFNIWIGSNSLATLSPGYTQAWTYFDPPPSQLGNYGTPNGIYHNHGNQNPLVPYNGRLYVHRSNAVIAIGPSNGMGKLPMLTIRSVQDSGSAIIDLKASLESEIEKIVDAGHLRPGYYPVGQFMHYTMMADYFDNPGDALLTLSLSYPHLSASLQDKVRTYLKSQFNNYFNPIMYARIGWKDGASRESMPIPPEVASAMAGFDKSTKVGSYANGYSWIWNYPQHNFYAMWKYSQIFLEDAVTAYELAKTKLELPPKADDLRMQKWPWEANAYIAGYIGFLELQKATGKTYVDSQLRISVTNELNRLLSLRSTQFTKDTPFGKEDIFYRPLNLSRNFLMLVPELGDYLNQHIKDKVSQAVSEYNYTAPYWFVSRYDASGVESARQNLYDYPAIFQAKAYILKESREELVKYLDVPAFEKGDLFYIQNLVAAIESPSSQTSTCPGNLNPDTMVNLGDLSIVLSNWGNSGGIGDANKDGVVNLGDIAYVLGKWGNCP